MVKPAYFPLITPVSNDSVTLVLLCMGQLLLLLLFVRFQMQSICQGNQTEKLVS